MIKVIIADDHQLLVDLINHKLSGSSEISVIGCANDGLQTIEMTEKLNPDVLLLDIVMPICDGIEVIKQIKSTNKEVKILILTSSDNENDVRKAMKNGADGYILKNINGHNLILAIKSVYANMEVIQKGLGRFNLNTFSEKNKFSFNNINVNVNGIDVTITKRELQIIQALADSQSVPTIASVLYLSEGRVRNIITGIISKLDLKDKTQIVIYALKNNLL